MEIRIMCPSCGHRYKATVSSPASLQGKTFVCKHCGARAPLASLVQPQHRPAPMKTCIGGMGGFGMPGGETRVAGATAGRRPILKVEATGRIFNLAQGTYILGRQSSDSKATLPLAPDRYMSRQQAKLTLTNAGGAIDCRIEVLNQVNPVYVNNMRLALGKSYRLRPGDSMLMGMTRVKYEEH